MRQRKNLLCSGSNQTKHIQMHFERSKRERVQSLEMEVEMQMEVEVDTYMTYM